MEISVLVGEVVKTVTISKSTTCSDVVKMAADAKDTKTSYAMYERSYGVDRLILSNAMIWKLVRSWGADRKSFSLVVRETDKTGSKMATMSRAKAKLQKLRSLLTQHKQSSSQKCRVDIESNLLTTNNIEKVYNKDIDLSESATEVKKMAQAATSLSAGNLLAVSIRSAKFDILKKYIMNSSAYVINCDDICTLPPRTRGDGADDEDLEVFGRVRMCGVGTDIPSAKGDQTYVVRSGDLDEAFISGERASEASDLNECFLCDTLDITSSESAFEDDSDCVSISELDKNIIDVTSDHAHCAPCDFGQCSDNTSSNMSRLRSVFSNGDLEAYVNDKDIESFMQTRLHEEDEGLSSLGSDNEDYL